MDRQPQPRMRVDRRRSSTGIARTAALARLFDLIDPGAYYTRPIALRNPDRVLRGASAGVQRDRVPEAGPRPPGVDARWSGCSSAASIPTASSRRAAQRRRRPSGRRAMRCSTSAPRRRAIVDALRRTPLRYERRHASRDARGEAIFTALEHEAMHQETLLYMWHRLPYEQKKPPAPPALRASGACPPPAPGRRFPPASRRSARARRHPVRLGQRVRRARVDVAAFEIDVHSVTNADFLEFVAAVRHARAVVGRGLGAARGRTVAHPGFWRARQWCWRGCSSAFRCRRRGRST